MNSPQPDPASSDTFDVAVIGYGPVGMTTAALLGRLGHRVVVLERYPGLYNLPRAGAFDGETMRTWAALGIAETLLPGLREAPRFDFRNGEGRSVLEFPTGDSSSGWPGFHTFYQPDLEATLDGLCRGLGVDVRLGTPVTGLSDQGAQVVLQAGTAEVPAKWVVACDGGNSFVREHLGIDQHDYGFGEPYLVCDFRLRTDPGLPAIRQICDPRQPTVMVSLGREHYRFAFLLGSVGDFEVESHPDAVWRKVAGRLPRESAELIRAATYTFRSLIARSWRHGRILLAGDAAHQMPPFLAQGMCSGIRDARNLAFKLDLVLRERAEATLLDTYQQEREPQVRWVVEKAIELGRIQTTRDPVAAAERDRRLLAQRDQGLAPASLRLPGLGSGFLSGTDAAGRGDLSVQAVVDDGTRQDRLDALLGPGFQLLVTEQVLAELARSGRLQACRAAGVVVAGLAENPGPGGVLGDVTGTYRRWFADLGAVAIAVRPDCYVYGTAGNTGAARALADELLDALAGTSRPDDVLVGQSRGT